MSECVVGFAGAGALEVETLLDLFPDWKFKAARIKEVRLFGTKMQVGRRVFCGSERLPVHETKRKELEECDVLVVAPDSKLKPHDVEALSQAGVAVVVLPGAVPGLGHSQPHIAGMKGGFSDAVKKSLLERPIVALAEDVAVIAARVLRPIATAFGLDAVSLVSYESASGSGRAGFDLFHEELQRFLVAQDLTPKESELYPWPMAFNVFSLDAAGVDKRSKVVGTLKEVLELPTLRISCQLARVPVFVGHALAFTVSLARPATTERFISLLRDEEFLVSSNFDEPKIRETVPASPRQVQGRDCIAVSDIRSAELFPNGLSFWMVADNLRTGVAANVLGTLDDFASSGVLSALQRRRHSRK